MRPHLFDLTPWKAVVDVDVSPAFDEALCRLPWIGMSLHKSRLNGVMLRTGDLPALTARVAASPLGRYACTFVLYAADEPGIVAPREAVLRGLDTLFWTAAGYSYLCGAELEPELRLDFEAFAEYEADEDGLWLAL